MSEKEEAAFARVIALASRTEQASSLLRARLLKEGHDEDAAALALERALACGIVDDSRYASALVRKRLSMRRGMKGVERELKALGIELSPAELLPDEDFSEEAEFARALVVLDGQPIRAKDRRGAAYRRLAAKGFSSALAAKASRYWHERNPL